MVSLAQVGWDEESLGSQVGVCDAFPLRRGWPPAWALWRLSLGAGYVPYLPKAAPVS